MDLSSILTIALTLVIKIDETDMITKEDVVVLITKDGYIKRSSLRSFSATTDEVVLKDNDYVIGMYEMSTLDTLLVFTSLGNYLYIPVHTIFDINFYHYFVFILLISTLVYG